MSVRATEAQDQPGELAQRQRRREPLAIAGYQQLAEPFETTFHDVRGGIDLEYITGEQCVSRLNETLGFDGWSFRVVEHDTNAEADEVWVLGELTVFLPERGIVRQQFGSQKTRRSRTSGLPLDVGFDLKAATTDALKKCASLIGVGLYLSRKEPPEPRAIQALDRAYEASDQRETCADCGGELRETRFKDGTFWPPAQLASYGRRKHGKALCMEHYRAANEARKAALLEDLPA